MTTIKMLASVYSYIRGHIYGMPGIDAEALVMSGYAEFYKEEIHVRKK